MASVCRFRAPTMAGGAVPRAWGAAPELKARKTFPSTSSMNEPSPSLMTRGRYLQFDCETTFSSLEITALARGPGGRTLTEGLEYFKTGGRMSGTSPDKKLEMRRE